ncbi:hypothetical protein CCYA_CCYA10G2865 [Cyanidiococcus yangmingshanensis]|nr:hypothetical protein CCYA_CCYA10G2865 [Cyanidiococcus yangmingshanensis]
MTPPRRKNKFSLLDLRAEVAFLRDKLGSGARVLNVYNLSRKTYLLKLSVPPSGSVSRATTTDSDELVLTGDSSWQREYLLIESGIRLHTTRFARQAAAAYVAPNKASARIADSPDDVASTTTQLASLDLDERDRDLQLVLQRQRSLTGQWNRAQPGGGSATELPSGFALKLRKHLRTRRLAEITQLGIDRVVDLRFVGGSQSAAAYKANPGVTPSRALLESHLIVELHSGGNIILTDGEYRILAVLRIFRPDQAPSTMTQESSKTDASVARPRHQVAVVGATYEISLARQLRPLSAKWLHEILSTFWEGRKNASISTRDLQRALLRALGWGPELIEHALHEAGPPASSIAYETRLYTALSRVEPCLYTPSSEGYILLLPSDKQSLETEPGEAAVTERYVDFSPRLLHQHAHLESRAFATFDEAVDEYFARQEEMQLQQEMTNRQRQAQGTLERMKTELESRVAGLRHQEEHCLRQALLIEANLVDVDHALQIIRAALASGIDWKEIEQMLVLERRRGNPIAQIIHSLQLSDNEMTLMLSGDARTASTSRSRTATRLNKTNDNHDSDNESDDGDHNDDDIPNEPQEEDESIDDRVELVKIDISQSAFANAQRYYEQRKKAAEKEMKTIEASEHALRAAEKKALKVLAGTASKNKRKKTAPLNTLKEIRKSHWFEKFRYFITSENYLVIAGKDSQQNEQLVRRYLEENTGDLYMHADVHGAASVIIKGRGNRPAPPLSIQEAAIFAAACSSAWDAKVAVNAFWVYPEQVSQSAPSGMHLNQGSFVVRGQRNYVPVTTSGSGPMVMGFGFLFRLALQSVWRHLGERSIRSQEVDTSPTWATQSQAMEAALADARSSMTRPQNHIRVEQEHCMDPNGSSEIPNDHDAQDEAKGDDSHLQEHGATLVSEQFNMNGTAAVVPQVPGTICTTSCTWDSKSANESGLKSEQNRDVTPVNGSHALSDHKHVLHSTSSSSRDTALATAGSHRSSEPDKPSDARVKRDALDERVRASLPSTSKGGEPLAAPSATCGAEMHSHEGGNRVRTQVYCASSTDPDPACDSQSVLSEARAREAPLSAVVADTLPALQPETAVYHERLGNGTRARCERLDVDPSEPKDAVTSTAVPEQGPNRPSQATRQVLPSRAQAPSTKPVRGKRGKLKKLREKYADQTEEEREAALRLLGTTKMRLMEAKVSPVQEASDVTAIADGNAKTILSPQDQPRRPKDGRNRPQTCLGRASDAARDSIRDTNASDISEFNTASSETMEQSRGAREELRFHWQKLDQMEVARALTTAGDALVHNLTPSQRANLSELDFFTGCPHPDDILEYALPVCAPYQTLSKYKYKVKLLPGTLKKGKALKQMMDVLVNQQASEARHSAPATAGPDAERQRAASTRELDLIRAIDETTLVQQMLGNVRVLAPGLQEHQRKQRMRKKHERS